MWLTHLLKRALIHLLTLEARLVLRKYQPTIIAVTGSVGKTSTKDAIYSVLSRVAFVRKSQKSLNTDIGIPLTILGCENAWSNPLRWLRNLLEGLSLIILPNHYPEWLVLEVGADRPGDIRRITSWLTPSLVVLTRIPDIPVHVEFFDSPEAVLEEKSHLVEALPPSGTLIAYVDDDRVRALAEKSGVRIVSFGERQGATIRGMHFRVLHDAGIPRGISFRVECEGEHHAVEIKETIGRQQMFAGLAAIAVAHALGKNLVTAVEGLRDHETPPGRMRILPGIKGAMIIDDSYNSSPVAAEEALRALGSLPAGKGRKIAVLGDMTELGRFSPDAHRAVGGSAAGVAHLLLTVGFRAREIAEGALVAGMPESAILQYEDSRRAGKELEGLLQEGDIVLIKGSQVMRMERAVEEIMAEPEEAADLLVRQDEEWHRRV